MTVDVDYAKRGDINIAYQVVGDGDVDIIFAVGLVSHLELMWADPHATAFLWRLSELGRLILFDKPGTGLSDPVVGMPTVEQRAQDFLAVLDAAGSRQAVVVGYSEASSPAALLAATYPERVEGLLLLSGFPKSYATAEFLPHMVGRNDEIWAPLRHSSDHWGDGSLALTLSPWLRSSAVYRRLAPSMERACASPGMARTIIQAMWDYDVRSALDAISARTRVIHRTDEYMPIEFGRVFAERIDGAEMVELPGDEHIHFYNGDDIVEAIASFIGGRPAARTRSSRALATVLFTDIVDSTATAAAMGDDRWRALLARHDAIAADEIERHGGRLVKHLGDGLLATFDRPLLSIRCALALATRSTELGLEMRAGIHTGECDVVGDDVAGIAVHIGARMAALAGPGEVVVSSTVRDLVLGSGVHFADRGAHELKGVPGQWPVLAVVDDHSADQAPPPGLDEDARAAGAATPTMRRLDKAIVRVAATAPWLTRPALRLVGRIRTRGSGATAPTRRS